MELRALIREARKYLRDPEEDGDFGPVGRAARGTATSPPKPLPPCAAGTVRMRKADGTSSCEPLRGGKR